MLIVQKLQAKAIVLAWASSFVLLLGGWGPSEESKSGSFLAVATNAVGTNGPFNGQAISLKLNDKGDTALAFNTQKENETVVVSMTARCSFTSGDSQVNFAIFVDAFIDGKPVPPLPTMATGASPFCISDTGYYLPFSTLSGVYLLKTPGRHILRMEATSIVSSPSPDYWTVAQSVITIQH